jgi:hypothetical protein
MYQPIARSSTTSNTCVSVRRLTPEKSSLQTVLSYGIQETQMIMAATAYSPRKYVTALIRPIAANQNRVHGA